MRKPLHFRLVSFFSQLVPRRFRSDWRNEWDAELAHNSRDLTRRSLGSFWDALAMQPRRLEEDFFQDLRYGVRMLFQTKAWSAVAIFSLALGIGANTALFSVFSSLLLQKLPAESSHELVAFKWAGRNDVASDISGYGLLPQSVGATFSYPAFERFRSESRTLKSLAAFRPRQGNFVADDQAEMVTLELVSGNYHQVLNARANAGRTLTDSDDVAAVISDRFWQRRFSRSETVLGKAVRINGVTFTIVGVAAPEFYGATQVAVRAPDVWIPLASELQFGNPGRIAAASQWWLLLVGRVRDGIAPQQVQTELQAAFQSIASASLLEKVAAAQAAGRESSLNPNPSVPQLQVVRGDRGIYDPSPDQLQTVAVLMGIVALVLLVVCANVANLLLARSSARQQEISIRKALGATRLRLVRQVLTESVLLSGIGGLFGIAIGYAASRLLPLWIGEPQPLDWRVIAFTAAVTLVTGILFGIAPAMRSSRADLSVTLRTKSILGKSLLVSQVGISVALLVGAGLLLQTIRNLYAVDLGFDTRNILLFRIDPQANGYDGPRFNALNEEIAQRLEAIPGVRSVALSTRNLVNGGSQSSGIHITGNAGEAPRQESVTRLHIRHTFFDTMQIPVLRGRALSVSDNEAAPLVAVINETMAKQLFGGRDALGARFGFDGRASSEIEVVGIVQDSRNFRITETIAPTIYIPYTQRPTAAPRLSSPTFEVRTAGDALAIVPQVRAAVREIEPNIPLIGVRTQVDEIGRRVEQQRLLATAASVFAGLTLILACTGLFGLMSYAVTRRRREIGIRMAVGARRFHVIGMVMRETLILAGLGVMLGSAAAIALSDFVANLVFGVPPRDAMTIGAAVTLVVVVSALAGFLPALRAARVDPMQALRAE